MNLAPVKFAWFLLGFKPHLEKLQNFVGVLVTRPPPHLSAQPPRFVPRALAHSLHMQAPCHWPSTPIAYSKIHAKHLAYTLRIAISMPSHAPQASRPSLAHNLH